MVKARSVASGVAFAFVLTAACANDWGVQAEMEARALIGKEAGARTFDDRVVPNESSCTHQGGGFVVVNNESSPDWGSTVARCQDRLVLLLERKIAGAVGADGRARWLIVDTLLLPPDVSQTGSRRLSLTSATVGECDWEGNVGRDYYAALHYGNRIEIDGHSGVEYAWSFDLERGRIVPVSTEGFICERIEP
jgi:hypothetical protein